MGLTVRWNPGNTPSTVSQSLRRLGTELRFALDGHGDWAGRRWQRTKFGVSTAPFLRNPSSDRLRSRTGKLRRSYRSQTRGRGLEITLVASVGNASTADYARLQEEGGTIKPKNGEYLTIPLEPNYTAAGRVRFESAAALRRRDDIKTFIMMSKKGNPVIWRKLKRKKNGLDIEPLFVLLKEVKVPPRLGFKKFFFEDQAVRDREARIGNALKRFEATG